MAVPVKSNIMWIGKTDWELRKFHGDEYSTHRGSTYNSYLIREEKTVLIDTVWKPFAQEFVTNLRKIIPLEKIDYVIANHAESDHSGALPDLMKHIPEKPIYCSQNGIKSLKGHYHQDWNFIPIKTGQRLSIGPGKDLIFIEAPMLHWPDSMMEYLTGDHVLFSNDAFGQHYATEYLFNDLVNQDELFSEAIKYYANILTPFSKLVKSKIDEFVQLNLPLDIICTSHGVIWRNNPMQIVQKYLDWSQQYKENQITLIYDTMWNGTRVMAENIAKGIQATDSKVNIKIFNSAKTDKNDLVTEVFRSNMIGIGSPTVNKGILTSVAALLEELRGLGFKDKKAFAFGTYGWNSESVKIISENLKNAGFSVVTDGLKLQWMPNDDESTEKAIEFGKGLKEYF